MNVKMAEMLGVFAGFVIILGIVLNFSLHKLEEGHVGVYYRKGTIGMMISLHEITNDNGIKLIDFAMSKGMIISSIFFPAKDIHKRTWKLPDRSMKKCTKFNSATIKENYKRELFQNMLEYKCSSCDVD
ncbi:hypothetical protein C0J52_04319 [Blattella germanica]|nr:hypothetical protein C0J52_04319 [Blattella germanica]